MRRAMARWVCLVALLATSFSCGAEEVVTVSGRKGETQSYLLMYNPPPPKAVAVLFPGGEGLLKLRTEGSKVMLQNQTNFLVRTRGLFCDNEVAVAILDSPSDQQRAG